jgi:hypothetical protein
MYGEHNYVAVSSRPAPYTSTHQKEGTMLDMLVIAPATLIAKARTYIAEELQEANNRRVLLRPQYEKYIQFLESIPEIDIVMGRGSYFDQNRVFVESADIDLLVFVEPENTSELVATLKAKLPQFCNDNPLCHITYDSYFTKDIPRNTIGTLNRGSAVISIDIIPKFYGDDLAEFVSFKKPSTYEKNMFSTPILPICRDAAWLNELSQIICAPTS